MQNYLPYIVSVVSAVISGFFSYCIARKKSKDDIQIITKQHEVDIDALKMKHQMEIEKLNIEHKNQIELREKDFEAQLSSSIIAEVIKAPEFRRSISQGIRR